MRSLSRRVALVVLLLATSAAAFGCHSKSSDQPDIQPITRLKVENRNYLDHTIYVLRGSERIRLGMATGSSTTTFRIPPNIIFGGTQLRFIADPVGARGAPVSEAITVQPGDEVGLTIPPL